MRIAELNDCCDRCPYLTVGICVGSEARNSSAVRWLPCVVGDADDDIFALYDVTMHNSAQRERLRRRIHSAVARTMSDATRSRIAETKDYVREENEKLKELDRQIKEMQAAATAIGGVWPELRERLDAVLSEKSKWTKRKEEKLEKLHYKRACQAAEALLSEAAFAGFSDDVAEADRLVEKEEDDADESSKSNS